MRVALVGLVCCVVSSCSTDKRDWSKLPSCLVTGVGREARCFDLQVPENPDAPNGRRITIHTAVFPAEGSRPLADPVFVFAGGPGQSAVEVASGVLPRFSTLTGRRDVVFVDQRGTGGSNSLECPDAGVRLPLAVAFDAAHERATLRACREALTARGDDLAQYATWIAMRDLDAVRAHLGYERINLWGASYGTRAALEYARQFPSHVRSVVLDGVAPSFVALPDAFAADTDAALEKWLAQAPGLRADVEALRHAEDAGTQFVDPFFGAPGQLQLTHQQLVSMLRGPLYSPSLAAVLPYAAQRAARGDFTALLGLSTGLGGKISTGMHFSVLCAEDVPRVTAEARRAAEGTFAKQSFIELYEEACRDWPVRPVPPEYFAPPHFDAPVLLLSGALDPATPPKHAAQVAAALPHALHIVAPTLSHGVSATPCASTLMQRFMSKASFEGLDAGCLADIPMPTLFEPVEAAP